MIIWGVLLFISGCLIADAARHYDDKTMLFVGGDKETLCDLLKEPYYDTDARCGHLVGAVVRYQLLYLCQDVYLVFICALVPLSVNIRTFCCH